ncbi:hypothetical protein AO372_0198 [Moraxella catarrhalis]|nr:hypothetical protein AO372_0198 [Moraxella catarrhalis]
MVSVVITSSILVVNLAIKFLKLLHQILIKFNQNCKSIKRILHKTHSWIKLWAKV